MKLHNMSISVNSTAVFVLVILSCYGNNGKHCRAVWGITSMLYNLWVPKGTHIKIH